MASADEARAALYAAIKSTTEKVEGFKPGYQADALLKLAEALAWVTNPNQPHGGRDTVNVSS